MRTTQVPNCCDSRGEGCRAVEQPLIDLHAGGGVARIEFSGFFAEIFEDRAGLAKRDSPAGAVVIDDRRYLVAGADLEELRLHLRLLADVDRDDLVRKPGLLEHHARLVAVVGGPGVAVDHRASPFATSATMVPSCPALCHGCPV